MRNTFRRIRYGLISVHSMLFLIGLLAFSSCEMNTNDQIMESPTRNLDQSLSRVLDVMEKDPAQALADCDQLIDRARQISSDIHVAQAMWYKAYIYDEILEDVSKAYSTYQDAIKIANGTDDYSLRMKLQTNLGLLFRFHGQYDAAIRSYEEALAYEVELSGKERSDLYYNVGVALKLKGDSVSFFMAEEAFTKSIEIAKRIEDHENIASVNNQIGLMYKAMGNNEMARIAYQNTIRDYQSDPGMNEHVGKAYHAIGVTFMNDENDEAAIHAFNKALEYKRSSGSRFVTKYDMGSVHFNSGRTEEAIEMWKDALSEKHNMNDREQVQIYADLTRALMANEQYKEAVDFALVYTENTNSILSDGDRYKSENNQVIFADIVREYDEFNRTMPVTQNPMVFVFGLILVAALLYIGLSIYYRSKIARTVSAHMNQIRTEFHHIKVD